MNAKWGFLVTVTASVACTVGCGTIGTQAVTRGQSPSHHGPLCADGACQHGPEGSYGPGEVYYEDCPPAGCHQCGDAGCMVCCPWAYNVWPLRKLAESRAAWNNAAWMPNHRTHLEYERPENLLYPPQHVPPAVTVYPYYTVKGPSDFFLQ